MLLRNKLLNVSFCIIMPSLMTACQSDSSQSMGAGSNAKAVLTESIDAGKVIATATPVVTETSATGKVIANAEASVKNHSGMAWSISAKSKDNHFDGILQCEVTPFVGDFQNCQLQLSQSGEPVDGAMLAIDGGMKAHGHGLPTQPKVLAVEGQVGDYKIEGLKFSMPGAWTVGFLIKTNGESDQLIFDFTI
jgi:hypothetical protein